VGDWGTQFGMLITHLKEACPEALASGSQIDIGDLVTFYKQAKKRFDEDDDFKTRSREAVVGLQAGDETPAKAWQALCEQSRQGISKALRSP
jgi:arginyl-tRNA synthetase